MLIYATPAELTAAPWNCTPVTGEVAADDLLLQASILVAERVRGATYEHDDTGKATETAVTEALRNAVCAQAKFWNRAKIDPTAAGNDAPVRRVASKNSGSRSIAYEGTSVTTAERRADAATVLCPSALSILRVAGLLYWRVRT